MEITQSTIRGACVCRVAGSLGMEVSDDLRNHLFQIGQTGAKAVVLNLEKVAFISSVCLGAFVGFSKTIAKAGGKVALCELSPPIHKLFKIAKLDQFFLIGLTESLAIEAVIA